MNDALALQSLRVQRDLAMLAYPARPWVRSRRTPQGENIFDVLIVGGGQSGLACAFGLVRERVENIVVLDENPIDRAGPWLSFARMHTLRTPKHLTGPDLGIPSLTPRAWYEAQHGDGSWDALHLLPKRDWADYLAWYRQTLSLPVVPDTRVGALRFRPELSCWEVPCEHNGQASIRLARRVVLATGIDGSGAWLVPSFIERVLPSDRYAHTRHDIDFAKLRGKRVAVLGAGASAFDNASAALEGGAAQVKLFFRRPELVRVNPYRWAEFVGFLHHFADLDDLGKWRFVSQLFEMGQLPPADTYARACELSGFQLCPGEPFEQVAMAADRIRITTPKGTHDVDFLIVATGFVTDLSLRPELANVHPHIATWADRFEPPEPPKSADLLRHPYLGPHFELLEKTPGSALELSTLYNYTFGCLLSMGFGGASISGMKYSVPRLVSGITKSLFLEDREAYFESLASFDEKEL